MTTEKSPQTMKPETAAKKLGIYLPAAPAEFRDNAVSRTRLNELLADPPEWLSTLKSVGPHPRPVVAGKLGVSVSGLARSGIVDPLTTEEIQSLLKAPPAWLVTERSIQAHVRSDKEELAARKADAQRLGFTKAN